MQALKKKKGNKGQDKDKNIWLFKWMCPPRNAYVQRQPEMLCKSSDTRANGYLAKLPPDYSNAEQKVLRMENLPIFAA